MKYFLLLIILLNYSCSKQKSILICGDHKCVNKLEAKQYFEENLTIEVQIISNDNKSSFNLVDLNVNNEKQNIKIFKNEKKKIVKRLSKNEIKVKKAEVKKKNKKLQTKKKKIGKKSIVKKKNTTNMISTSKNNENSIDICLKLKKCDIDSIASYLIKASKEKDFPNISSRE